MGTCHLFLLSILTWLENKVASICFLQFSRPRWAALMECMPSARTSMHIYQMMFDLVMAINQCPFISGGLLMAIYILKTIYQRLLYRQWSNNNDVHHI